MLLPPVYTYLQERRRGRATPGFPVEFNGVGEPHAAFLTESRTRGPVRCSVQEIRVAHLFQPMYAKTRTWGTVQGARPCEVARDLSHHQRMTLTCREAGMTRWGTATYAPIDYQQKNSDKSSLGLYRALSRCRDLIQLLIAHSVAIKRIVYVAFGVEGVKGIAIVLVEGKPQLDAFG